MRLRNTLKNIISILFFLVLLIPVYEVFVPYENKAENECWELRFIWEDSMASLSYTLLALGWILNIAMKKRLLRILLVAFSVMNIIGSFLSITIPSQDLVFLPGIGVFIVLCFLILIYLIRIMNINSSVTFAKGR